MLLVLYCSLSSMRPTFVLKRMIGKVIEGLSLLCEVSWWFSWPCSASWAFQAVLLGRAFCLTWIWLSPPSYLSLSSFPILALGSRRIGRHFCSKTSPGLLE